MKLRMHIVCFALLVHPHAVAGETAILASEPLELAREQSSELRGCLDDPKNMYTHETSICIVQEVQRKDREIEKIINRNVKWIQLSQDNVGASPSLRKEQVKLLRASQKDWQKYRESWCQLEASLIVGTTSPLVFVECQLKLTIKRIAELTFPDG